jgi:Bacterial regulatory proteins, luxR family
LDASPLTRQRRRAWLAALGISARGHLLKETAASAIGRTMQALVSGELVWVPRWPSRCLARQLGTSEGTVRSHPEKIYERLQVSGRTAAVTRALADRVVACFGYRPAVRSRRGRMTVIHRAAGWPR